MLCVSTRVIDVSSVQCARVRLLGAADTRGQGTLLQVDTYYYYYKNTKYINSKIEIKITICQLSLFSLPFT